LIKIFSCAKLPMAKNENIAKYIIDFDM